MVLNITQAIRNSQDVRNPNNTNIYVLAEMTQVIAASLIKSNLPGHRSHHLLGALSLYSPFLDSQKI